MRALVVTLMISLAASDACAQGQRADPPQLPSGASLAGIAFWLDYRRGWHWYEDPEPEPAQKTLPTPKPAKPAEPDERPPELVQFEQLQKRVEEYRNIAIMNPSEDNVRRYMRLEASIVRRASHFADVAQRVAWATPELDMTLEGRPVNAQAIAVFDRQQAEQRSTTVADLGQTHVLFFFFRSDCPYCHAFAPTLAAFQKRHGLQVVPVSVDGGAIAGFDQFRRDNGIAKTLQVSQVPAVFLAEPFSGKITPIGYGVLSEAQLLERIAKVTAPSAVALTPSITRRVSLP